MINLYEEAQKWLQDYWQKDTSFKTRLQLVPAILFVELIDVLNFKISSINIEVNDFTATSESTELPTDNTSE